MNTKRILLLVFFFSLVLPSAFPQGSLTPPGAPAPTMKTLDQVEPRIDLQNAPASAVTTTDANYHFIITQPGSYYLSGNLGVTKTNGIQINAEGVTLDLNGFEISRASGSGGNGIEIPATSHRASIRNGSLKGFANGVNSLFSTTFANACAFRDLSISGCTSLAIRAGLGSVLESCRVHDNSGTYGILAGNGSTLRNCTATGNTGNTASFGIFAGFSSTLTNCSAYGNTAQYGIYASAGSTLSNCAAYGNIGAAATSAGIGTNTGCTVSYCSASFNDNTGSPTPTGGMGFDVGVGNTIRNCTASTNRGDGINVDSNTVVRENTCATNGYAAGDGAGIHATSSDNRIEGNNVADNDRGIDVDLAGNIIVRNTASGNTTNNWDVVAGNVILVINATAAGAVTGNSGGTAPGSTDPSANFTY